MVLRYSKQVAIMLSEASGEANRQPMGSLQRQALASQRKLAGKLCERTTGRRPLFCATGKKNTNLFEITYSMAKNVGIARGLQQRRIFRKQQLRQPGRRKIDLKAL